MNLMTLAADRLIDRVSRREPDLTIFRKDNEHYIHRWYLISRNKGFNAYLHETLLDDDEPPHDHPWPNCSIILRGGYWETVFNPLQDSRGVWHLGGVSYWRGPGAVVFRRATTVHRLTVENTVSRHSWSLFLTGPVVRNWGFWGVRGWVSHKLILDIKYGPGGYSRFNPEKAKHWLQDSDFTRNPA